LKTQLLAFVISGLFTLTTTAHAAAIWCEDEALGQIREIDNRLVSEGDDCVAGIIWAHKNLCFEGDSMAIAQRINNGDYVWLSEGLMAREATAQGNSVVRFIGVDQRSFYMAERAMDTCSPEFLARIKR
jgi:hypothetical protein